MPSETLKQGGSHTISDGENHRQFNRDIKGMVSAITHRVSDLHKAGSSRQEEDEDRSGASIITLAGTNHGATMRKEMDGKSVGLEHGPAHGGEDELNTYVNSNFQAVNNSIMFGSHYNTNDPGVHMEVSDVREHEHGHGGKEKEKKKGKKKEKKEKEKEKEKGSGEGKSASDQHSD